MAVTNELKVGVMVVISAFVLIVGIMFLKEIRGRSAVTHWKVGFLQVGGLSNGDPVLVQGVKRGDVDDIDLRGRVVIVDLKLRKEIRLTRSSRVAISSQGIVGERTVSIDLGPPD